MQKFIELLPLLIPIIALQLIVQIVALVNLIRRKKVRFNSKLLWGIIIVTGMLGSIIYFIARGDED